MDGEWSGACTRTTRAFSHQRHFTVAQANAALTLVERIVLDIVEHHRRIMNLAVEPTDTDIEAARRAAAGRLHELVGELSALGCELRDWEYGLVDFPALMDGREVYLCWKLGESSVSHWHDLHGGFKGRESIGVAGRW